MDLNLYLGSSALTSDQHMDLGSDLSLGPLPTSASAGHDPAEADDIFRGFTPVSPSQGLSSASSFSPFRVFGHTFLPYSSNLPQSPPSNAYPPIFDDDYIDILGDGFNLSQPPLGNSGADAHALYIPTFEPFAAQEETRDSLPIILPQRTLPDPNFPRYEVPSQVESLFRSPHLRFRSLIQYETSRQERAAAALRRRASSPPPAAAAAFGRRASSPPPAAAAFRRRVSSPPPATAATAAASNRPPEATTGDEKSKSADGSKEMTTGKVVEENNRNVNFECNICLDIAKEPVVTSCGHLFCWPCLYQWLHLHSVYKECPVCKGEVDANITPIYGRGVSETDGEEGTVVGGDVGLKIPSRPRGRRFESLRQQLQQQLQRPMPRRLLEGFGSPWRRIGGGGGGGGGGGDWRGPVRAEESWRGPGRAEESWRGPGRAEESWRGPGRAEESWRVSRPFSRNSIQNERVDAIHNRVRARMQFRLADTLNFGANSTSVMDHLPATPVIGPQLQNTGSVNQGPENHFHGGHGQGQGHGHGHVSVGLERQSIMRNEDTIDSSSVDARITAPSASVAQPESNDVPPVDGNPRDVFVSQPPATSHSADQATASSTLALIEDDGGANDALVEPNSVGSSGLLRRRRRWTEASGSLDYDGGFPPAIKRTRLN